MTSSAVTGDRKWASARRGGMTVLGKVAVPKPINLPSQRLENHGLDPAVEIVPKGTLGWGSRSSAGSNAWGVPASPPGTDGSSSSHSVLAGRPSSGGGTRPSTAGSEKAHDSNLNAWSSNSRPSSASGILASNNASVTSLRPRSAETKSGGSHLSRFAGPLAEGSGSWGSCAAPEHIGVSNSGKDGFSLTSGDFPTLGSEKDESRKIMEPLDNISKNTDSEDPGRQDGPPCVEDGPRPNIDGCYGEPHLYQNPNMAPPHYDSWRGAPPVNTPSAIWFRGPPGRPPYGPGGFPIEPFPYYRPQVQGPGLANSPPVPPPGADSHGHFSKNGDIYRPHMSEPYMRPSMPIRPGFYPSPVPYESYYGPPMGFHNPNERDLPFMGMPNGPLVYNRPVHPHLPDPNFCHSRPSEGRTQDQVEPGYSHDPRGNSNILKKQTDGRNRNDELKWGHRGFTGSPHREKGILSLASVQEIGWEDKNKKNENMHYGKSAPPDGPLNLGENKFGSSNPAILKFPGSVKNVEGADTSHITENATSPKDNSLIQKIEGLNAKARASVGTQDVLHTVEQHEEIQTIDTRVNQSTNDADSRTVLDRHNRNGVLVYVPHEIHFGTVGASHEFNVSSVTTSSRKSTHGAQNRGDHHVKGGADGQEADGRRKRSESSPVVAEGSESKIDHAEVPKPNVEKGNYESSMPTFGPSDAQCAIMREPKQQTSQLQIDEKEWAREKKNKAPAKLEELNQHSRDLATRKSGHRVGSASAGNDASHKPEGSKNQLERRYDVNQSTRSSSASSDNIAQAEESGVRSTVRSTIFPMLVGSETKKISHQDSALSKKQLPTADLDINDNGEVSKHKRVGHKHRQNTHQEKIFIEESIPAARKDLVKDPKESCEVEIAGAKVVSGTGNQAELLLPLLNQKKKSKSVKNKHKVAELSTEVSLSGDVGKDNNQLEVVPELQEQNACSSSITSSSILPSVARETHSSSSHEDAHGRPNNLWKPQNSRKHRNSLSYRSTDKSHNNDAFVWTPVRFVDKVEEVDQTNHKIDKPSASVAIGDNLVSSNLKTKRAEMERYIPKPVAKELAQQGSTPQAPSSSVDQATTNGTDCRLKASQSSDYVGKAGSSAESKHSDSKNSQRTQGSWRQRVSTESTIPAQASIENSSAAPISGKDFQTSYVCEQNVKSDESSVGGPSCRSDDEPSTKGPQQNVVCEWSDMNDSGRKDHVPFGRAKRHPRHKGRGGNLVIDHEDFNAGLTDLQHSHVETSHTERVVPSKENRAVGDRAMSHWQPKAQSYVAHSKQASRSNSSQNFNTGDTNKTLKRETDRSDGTHQENNKDKLGTSVQGLPCSPNQRSVGNAELGAFGVAEGHNEQHPSSRYRKNANYGSRFNKGHESRGDWNSTWQENKEHYSAVSRERQRPNAHYEYQSAGSFNSSGRISDDSGSQTPFQSGDPKFRERGPNHVRRGRGNFHGRQRGNPTEAGTG